MRIIAGPEQVHRWTQADLDKLPGKYVAVAVPVSADLDLWDVVPGICTSAELTGPVIRIWYLDGPALELREIHQPRVLVCDEHDQHSGLERLRCQDALFTPESAR